MFFRGFSQVYSTVLLSPRAAVSGHVKCRWAYTPMGGHTWQAAHTHAEGRRGAGDGAAVGLSFWVVGWRLFVPDLYHFLWTPTMEVITLLSQNGFWLRVKKSSCFPAKRWQINLRSWLELLIRAGSQGAWGCLSQVRAQLVYGRR